MSQIDQNDNNTVPYDIRRDMSDAKYRDKQGDKLLDKLNDERPFLYRESLIEITAVLKVYIGAHHTLICRNGVPLSACPSIACQKGQQARDFAIKMIASEPEHRSSRR